MDKIRVLIVDDSAVIGKFLAGVLSGESDFEVVGRAMNAEEALAGVRDTHPDVLTLDLEIPGVKGLDLLVAIRAEAPQLPVIMFNSMTSSAAAILLDAFIIGAAGQVSKPANTGGMAASVIHLQQQLVPKIRQLGRRFTAAIPAATPPKRSAAVENKSRNAGVVVIGASVGGAHALSALFSAMPAEFSLPVVISANTSAEFTLLLAERLAQHSPLEFKVAEHGDVLQPAHVYLLPNNMSACFVGSSDRACIDLGALDAEASECASLDRLFNSAASVFSEAVIAVMLAGIGSDGVQGCSSVYSNGGDVLLQDEATAIAWETPGLIANAGIFQKILPPIDIAAELCRRSVVAQGTGLESHL